MSADQPRGGNSSPYLGELPGHGRFAYRPIHARPDYVWPGGARLAVYLGFNLEHFAFGEGLGANIGPASPQPDVLNYSWREYGNRVGAWRCLSLFDQLGLPTGAIINTALYEHCPQLIEALVRRGDELIGHGHTNAERQGDMAEAQEADLLARCRQLIEAGSHASPQGWLSPWISESRLTPDLLVESGYRYTLNWAHDDQPVPFSTRSGQRLWSIPYPQELNDIPMIIGRQMNGSDFCDMIVDQFDEMLLQSHDQSLVMGIALHPYLVGQPYRLAHLRRALRHIVSYRNSGRIWCTTPGAIYKHVESLAQAYPASID